jgi:hypothetical protein
MFAVRSKNDSQTQFYLNGQTTKEEKTQNKKNVLKQQQKYCAKNMFFNISIQEYTSCNGSKCQLYCKNRTHEFGRRIANVIKKSHANLKISTA